VIDRILKRGLDEQTNFSIADLSDPRTEYDRRDIVASRHGFARTG
jgi:hypothetical protein